MDKFEGVWQPLIGSYWGMNEFKPSLEDGLWRGKDPFAFPYIAKRDGKAVQCRTRREAVAKYHEMGRARKKAK